jgi:hypothetical protein
MNERIKELAEQAVNETQLLMIMEYKDFESKLYEKFTELIVRECISELRDAFDMTIEEGNHLKQHFGVEE